MVHICQRNASHRCGHLILEILFTGHKFFIQIDLVNLKYLLNQRITTLEQQKWVFKLFGYDYEIIYKLGRKNKTTDALSRKEGSPTINALSIPYSSIWTKIKETTIDNTYIDKIGALTTDNPGIIYGEMDYFTFTTE